ncbi:chemotaxis protein CheW [Maridesulfovibrio sp.]|uniref:chemotaxis protein CheW n=1 Tax=Maridesulfovibrio sp. TaxID=2795000 RepID=UPI002A187182|nr:chemotaxis protein CheW [Maridesulfovibrio sp.]
MTMEDSRSLEFFCRESDRELLRERAARLARKVEAEKIGEVRSVHAKDYVTFVMGGDLYGIEAAYVSEVYEPENLVQLPCTPEFLSGVISVRGRIWAVIDLCRFWGIGRLSSGSLPSAILLNDGDTELALAVDEIRDVIPVDDFAHKPLAEGQSAISRYSFGMTENRMVLLRAKVLLGEEAFVVNEFVGGI